MKTMDYLTQASEFLRKTKTEFECEFLKHGKHFEDDKEERDIYIITLKRGNRSFTFNFGQSITSSGQYKVVKHSEYDVLACLQKHDPGTFEDFCSEFGYDEDSRKAEKVYKAVLNEWRNVAMLWNDFEIEQLQEIN